MDYEFWGEKASEKPFHNSKNKITQNYWENTKMIETSNNLAKLELMMKDLKFEMQTCGKKAGKISTQKCK